MVFLSQLSFCCREKFFGIFSHLSTAFFFGGGGGVCRRGMWECARRECGSMPVGNMEVLWMYDSGECRGMSRGNVGVCKVGMNV